MSAVSDAAKAIVLLGDHASVDASQKVSIIGAGWTVTNLQPQGVTPGFAVAYFIEVPAAFYGESCSVSLSLLDDTGSPVILPGQPAPMRVAQVRTIDRPTVPGTQLPDGFPSRLQMIMNLPMGLPLQPGKQYAWELEIDGNTKPEWSAGFFVLGPPAGFVVG